MPKTKETLAERATLCTGTDDWINLDTTGDNNSSDINVDLKRDFCLYKKYSADEDCNVKQFLALHAAYNAGKTIRREIASCETSAAKKAKLISIRKGLYGKHCILVSTIVESWY